MLLVLHSGWRSALRMYECIAERELEVIGLARPICIDSTLPNKLLQYSKAVHAAGGHAGSIPEPEVPQVDLELNLGMHNHSCALVMLRTTTLTLTHLSRFSGCFCLCVPVLCLRIGHDGVSKTASAAMENFFHQEAMYRNAVQPNAVIEPPSFLFHFKCFTVKFFTGYVWCPGRNPKTTFVLNSGLAVLCAMAVYRLWQRAHAH